MSSVNLYAKVYDTCIITIFLIYILTCYQLYIVNLQDSKRPSDRTDKIPTTFTIHTLCMASTLKAQSQSYYDKGCLKL